MAGQPKSVAALVLAPFLDQKTVVLTTYRRDGAAVKTAVNIDVEGEHAYIRSYENAWKVRRIRTNPLVHVAPPTTLGAATGPAIRARARRLDECKSRTAAAALAREHPLLQGILVPLCHRLFRFTTGRTVHFELTPLADSEAHASRDSRGWRRRVGSDASDARDGLAPRPGGGDALAQAPRAAATV